MSFASEVKKECSERELTGSEGRAELSAMIQLTSSLTLSSEGMALLITAENTMIAKTILRLIKERYDAETILFVKRKMNLKKNLVYGIRVVSDVKEILTDLTGGEYAIDQNFVEAQSLATVACIVLEEVQKKYDAQ